MVNQDAVPQSPTEPWPFANCPHALEIDGQWWMCTKPLDHLLQHETANGIAWPEDATPFRAVGAPDV